MDKEKLDELILGQNSIKQILWTWYENGNFPHFLLIAGETGSGRKHISKVIGKLLDCSISIAPDCSADTIKKLIDSSYFIHSSILYIIPNADNMSASAKNSLLKLTEEPPENAYVIMTLDSLENTLKTLVSRSQSIVLEAYSKEDIRTLTDSELIANVASTPGMVTDLELIGEDGVITLLDYCRKVISSLHRVSTSNALKSSSQLKFKDTDKGYDLDIYFSALEYCLEEMLNSSDCDLNVLKAYYRGLAAYKFKFLRSGINKKALYDMFVLDVRRNIQGGLNGLT